MPTNRQETLPAVWAEEAEELPISGNPVVGTTYRKEAITPETIQAGWPYATINNSAEFNEVMRTITAMMRLLESWGMLPWSPATVYATGALVMGSNGTIYKALQATTNNDPVSSPTYWGVAFEVSGTSATHAALTSPHSATSEATASRLMVRDASGRCKVAAPSTVDQIARLDTVTERITTHNSVTNPHSATSALTASRIMMRDASGRTKVAAPSATEDAANKEYVDGLVKRFVSAPFTWTINTIFTFAHGLIGTPRNAYLIAKCTSAELGYSVGDYAFSLTLSDAGALGAPSVKVSSTNVSFAGGDVRPLVVNHLASASANHVQISADKWQFYLVAEFD